MKQICLLLAICCLLCGCAASAPAETEATMPVYPAASSSDFSLPVGYALADETTAAIIKTEDGQIVGGIINTELDTACLEESDSESIFEYLTSYPRCEYISQNADGFKAISMAVTDPQTSNREETARYLFGKDGLCYDLWLDSAALSHDERTVIRKAITGR